MDTEVAIVIVVGAVAFFVLLQRLWTLSARVDRISALESKVDALLRASGIKYDPLSTVPAGVREALERGEYIAAIKCLREATGAGLKEAKEQVDELRRCQGGASGMRSH